MSNDTTSQTRSEIAYMKKNSWGAELAATYPETFDQMTIEVMALQKEFFDKTVSVMYPMPFISQFLKNPELLTEIKKLDPDDKAKFVYKMFDQRGTSVEIALFMFTHYPDSVVFCLGHHALYIGFANRLEDFYVRERNSYIPETLIDFLYHYQYHWSGKGIDCYNEVVSLAVYFSQYLGDGPIIKILTRAMDEDHHLTSRAFLSIVHSWDTMYHSPLSWIENIPVTESDILERIFS